MKLKRDIILPFFREPSDRNGSMERHEKTQASSDSTQPKEKFETAISGT